MELVMIIDFRVRPPLKGFEKLSILGPQKGFQLYPFNFEDTEEIPSALQLSMPLFLKEMEEAGIGLGVVLPRVTNIGWGGVTNDEVAAGVAEYSDKLIGFGGVSVDGGIREAVQEVERAVTKLGLKGIVVEPGCCVPPRYPDANVMYPIYDRCAELGVPVVISQSMLLGPDMSYAQPECVQRAAHDFPGCKFIIAHASYPWVQAAVSVACVTENVWLIPDLYMNMAPVPGGSMFAEGLRFTHGKRMLFGSAYPVRSMGQSVRDLEAFHLPEKLYSMLTYDNAAELLGL